MKNTNALSTPRAVANALQLRRSFSSLAALVAALVAASPLAAAAPETTLIGLPEAAPPPDAPPPPDAQPPPHAAPTPRPPSAAAPEASVERIRDNLFLLEEAFNQDPGVIQHISVFQFTPKTKEWSYSLTDEWPVPNELNQLSLSLVLLGDLNDGTVGLGDVLFNYRIQAVSVGSAGWIAVAPRASLVLPVGDPKVGRGRGAIGVQLAVPVSMELGRYVALHLNAGVTITPSAHSTGVRTHAAVDANAGAAVVFQPLYWMNPLVEVAYNLVEEVGETANSRSGSLVVNPGVRFAIDHERTGLQVVPGVGAPIQVYPTDDRSVAVLGYLSFEHPAF